MIAFFEDSDYFFKLERLFEQYHIVARGWRDYDHLVERLRDVQPKVVLLDIEINDQTGAGLEALAVIKQRFPRIKTIVLTGHPEYVLRAFRGGADGYLLKEEVSTSVEYIQEVIEEVIHGKIIMSDEVRRIIVESLIPFENVNLNTRERQIICLAASDKSGPQIAEILRIKPQTVETYLKNIKTKLVCHTIQGVVAKALRNNLIDWDELIS
jgi:two-component system nitrate/nitrite response regulator NarL